MQKRKGLKTALLLALIFYGVYFSLNLLMILCDPLQRLAVGLFRNQPPDDKLSAQVKVILLITLSLAIVPNFILTLYNYSKPDLIKQRGVITIVLLVVLSILSGIISIPLVIIRQRLMTGDEYIMLIYMNYIKAILNYLTAAATTILYCCAAIEIYNGAEKPAYQPYNGDIINNEDTLS